MKHLQLFYCFLLLVLLALLVEPARAQTYVMPKDMTAGVTAKYLGIPFTELKKANPKMIKNSASKLKEGIRINLPKIYYEFYGEKYAIKAGYTYFFDKELFGSLLKGKAEYWFPINKNSGLDMGIFADVQGGFMRLKDGSYNEPGVHWGAGLEARLKKPGIFYEVMVGYFQDYLTANMSTGYSQRLFKHGISFGLEFHPYRNRFLNQSRWFNDAKLYLAGKIAIRDDTLFWLDKPINMELLAQQASLGGEVTVFDWSLSKALLLPIGVGGEVSQYDWLHKKSKFFQTSQVFMEILWNKQAVGRISAKYRSGVSGKDFNEFVIEASFGYSSILSKNE
jgi:hypothetical protein